MPERDLVFGATGRTGGQVLTELLGRGVAVRAIVRSADRLPAGVSGSPMLDTVEADPLGLSAAELADLLAGCDTVVSCLGHTISVRGLFGPPRDLVTRAVRNVRRAGQVRPPDRPVLLVVMGSVSVNLPGRGDARRGAAERAYLAGLRTVLPPVRDNQRAADFPVHEVGQDDPGVQWVVVRPDTLTEGEPGAYELQDSLVASVIKPASTRMTQVARLMAELACDDATWQRRRGRMPVIVDSAPD